MRGFSRFIRCGLVLALALPASIAVGDKSDYESRPAPGRGEQKPISEAEALFNRGTDEVGFDRFAEAEKLFTASARLAPRNAAVYNMLAYSQRKQGKLDAAFVNYQRALKLRPRFPEAREYLGEAHIQAALREMAILKSYGPEGKHALDDLIQAFKEAAASLDP
jgi:tetratricopeptide (TPR) repeat protein